MHKRNFSEVLIISTVVLLAVTHLVVFFAYQLGFDFTFLHASLPLTVLLKHLPLISITDKFIELQQGRSYSAKFVVETALFAYVYLFTTAWILFAGWKNVRFMHEESINRGLFSWLSFCMFVSISLVFFPTQVWGPHSMAFRWAVESEVRFLLLAVIVLSSHLFAFFLSDAVKLLLKGFERRRS